MDSPAWCWKEPIPLPMGSPRDWYALTQVAREVALEFDGQHASTLQLLPQVAIEEAATARASGLVVYPYSVPIPALKHVSVVGSYADVATKVFESNAPVYVVILEPQGLVAETRFVKGVRLQYQVRLVGRERNIGGRFTTVGDLCIVPNDETTLTIYHRLRMVS